MISSLLTLVELVFKYRIWGLVVILSVFIIYLFRIILDEDRSAVWRARIYKGTYKISGKSNAEKKYIENDINSRINLARRAMPFGKENLPKALKVEWFEGGKGETVNIKENEILVRLDPSESQEKNTVLLAIALVERTSLVGIRHILREPLEISIDLNLIKDLLSETGNKKILDWFFRNEYQPNIDKSDVIKEWNNKIVEIDERGLFTRLLLVELDNYSKKVSGRPSSPALLKEITDLIEFLYKIATKSYGQDVPLKHISRNIKIGITLVGKTSKILKYGIVPYLKAFAYNIEQDLVSMYVIQFDKELLGTRSPELYKEATDLMDRLDRRIEELFHIQKDFELKYVCIDSSGKKRNAKITRYVPEYIS